jgi:hypothetical protein
LFHKGCGFVTSPWVEKVGLPDDPATLIAMYWLLGNWVVPHCPIRVKEHWCRWAAKRFSAREIAVIGYIMQRGEVTTAMLMLEFGRDVALLALDKGMRYGLVARCPRTRRIRRDLCGLPASAQA